MTVNYVNYPPSSKCTTRLRDEWTKLDCSVCRNINCQFTIYSHNRLKIGVPSKSIIIDPVLFGNRSSCHAVVRLCCLMWYAEILCFFWLQPRQSNGYKIHSQFGPHSVPLSFVIWDVGKRSVSQMRSYYPKWIRVRAKPIVLMLLLRQKPHTTTTTFLASLFYSSNKTQKTGLGEMRWWVPHPLTWRSNGMMISAGEKIWWTVQTSVSKWSLLHVSTKSCWGWVHRAFSVTRQNRNVHNVRQRINFLMSNSI
jgi:hypothetical protein